jgi:hypothetical protein
MPSRTGIQSDERRFDVRKAWLVGGGNTARADEGRKLIRARRAHVRY